VGSHLKERLDEKTAPHLGTCRHTRIGQLRDRRRMGLALRGV